MLFAYEFKKVWQRVSPLLLTICVVGIAVVTMLISIIAFNYVPPAPADVSSEYADLAKLIENWDNDLQVEIKDAFDDFYDAYKKLNADTITGSDHVIKYDYQTAREYFELFYSGYYLKLINPENTADKTTDYLLIKDDELTDLKEVLELLDGYFMLDLTDAKEIIKNLPNAEWEGTAVTDVLDNLQVLILGEEDLATLQDFFAQYPANVEDYDYTDAYDYATNLYCLSIDRNTPHDAHLSTYNGFAFADYVDQNTSTQAVITAEYRLNHPDKNFAAPFTFGKIYNNGQKVSLMDFVFTNLEMAAIPLLLLVTIIAAAIFFTDTYQNTIITTVAATKNRSLIILTKALVVLTLAVGALLLFTVMYVLGGLALFQATLSADILFLFNGSTPVVMSAINYFVLYLLSWVFKFFPLIALAGIMSFAKAKPAVIVGSTLAVVIAIVLANALLGNFAFYRFMPWQALDLMRYCGATLFISPTPAGSNLWYTFPVMLVITGYLYWQLIHNFRRRDF